MNDIEILEEYIKELNKNKKKHELAYSTGFGKYWSDFGKAIENLIQKNKNLEQIEKEHKEENGRLREELENIEYIKRNFDYCLERKTKELEEENRIQRGQLNSAFNNGFIHKDKIKEIIDLYNNTLQCTRKYNEELANILCDLEELLEESEK